MNIVLRSNWFVSAGRYLFLNYFLLTEKVSKILIKTVLMKNSLNLFNSFAMVLSPFTSYFNVFYLVFTDWSIMKTIEIESLHPLVCHPIQILNHFHYWSKSTPTFNTWFFQFWLNARFFPCTPMFPIPAVKEADSWMVAHTKTTAIKKPRRFICKIVCFSSLTFD